MSKKTTSIVIGKQVEKGKLLGVWTDSLVNIR